MFHHERCIPGKTEKRVWDDHIARYRFASKFTKGKSVLDAACGDGYGSVYLDANSYLGLDIDRETIIQAVSKYKSYGNRVDFMNANLDNETLYNMLFDVIVCFETIEHVTNPEFVLGNFYNYLKQDGILLISTPNYTITKGLNPHHVQEWTKAGFVSLLAKAGFIVYDVLGQRPRPKSIVDKPRTILTKISDRLFGSIDERTSPEVKPIPPKMEARYLVAIAMKTFKGTNNLSY